MVPVSLSRRRGYAVDMIRHSMIMFSVSTRQAAACRSADTPPWIRRRGHARNQTCHGVAMQPPCHGVVMQQPCHGIAMQQPCHGVVASYIATMPWRGYAATMPWRGYAGSIAPARRARVSAPGREQAESRPLPVTCARPCPTPPVQPPLHATAAPGPPVRWTTTASSATTSKWSPGPPVRCRHPSQ